MIRPTFFTAEQCDLRYQCHYENCSKAFTRKDKLELHLRTHTGERPFVCLAPGCSRSYARSQYLTRHICSVHAGDEKVEFKRICPHCQLEFADYNCLKIHKTRFHTIIDGAKTYDCTEEGCQEVFHKKQQLVTHREKVHALCRISASSQIYKCPHEGCNKSFPYPFKLKRHMKIHEGYKCDLEGCNEVLSTWSKLRKHKVEEHSPGLECHKCQCTFKTRRIMTEHLKIHDTKEPIACTWEGCSRTFLYKKNLTQHIRAFHEGKQVFIKKPKLTDGVEKKRRRMPKKKTTAARLSGLDDRPKNFKAVELSIQRLLKVTIPSPSASNSMDCSLSPTSLNAVSSPVVDSSSTPDCSSDIQTSSQIHQEPPPPVSHCATENVPLFKDSPLVPVQAVST